MLPLKDSKQGVVSCNCALKDSKQGVVSCNCALKDSNLMRGFYNIGRFVVGAVVRTLLSDSKVSSSITALSRDSNICVTFFSASANSTFHPSALGK